MKSSRAKLVIFALAVSFLIPQGSYAYEDHHANAADIFKDFYLNWPSGNNDVWDRMDEFLDSQTQFVSVGGVNYTPQKYSFQDVNGDGLPDFLYHERHAVVQPRKYLALFLNSGDLNYVLVYRRAVYNGNYYGDCVEGVSLPPETDMINEVAFLMGFYYDTELPPVSPVMLDMNGDGLLDMFQHSGTTAVLYINDGNLNFNRYIK